MRKSLSRNPTQRQNKFSLHFLHGILLGDIPDWWVQDLGYTVRQSEIEVASTVMAPVWGMMGCAGTGGWENHNVAGERMHIATLFLK